MKRDGLYPAAFRHSDRAQLTCLLQLHTPATYAWRSADITKVVITYREQMAKKTKIKTSSDVDKGLVAMFLKMSIEERLRANDNAACTILY